MPTFEVTSPGGRKFRVTAPEGATMDDAIAYVQKKAAPPEMNLDPTVGMSGLDKFLAGAGKAIVDTGRGIGQLTGAIDQQEIDEAKRLDAPLMATGAGIGGNIAGNLATLIGPGAALGVAGKAAQLPRLARAGASLVAPQTVLGGAGQGAALAGLQPVATDESRGLNLGIGGLFGGLGTGAANMIGKRLGARAASITPEQTALATEAQQLGYALKPSEITGKRWQQNLEAAMAQMPSTAGRMQEIGTQNQALTNLLAEQALAKAGGAIDQPSAAAGAMEGWKQGLAQEEGRLGAAYRNLLGSPNLRGATVENADGGHYLNLADNGERVGRAFVKWSEKDKHPILWGLDVNAAAQGKGHGSKLLDASIDFARTKWPGSVLEVDAIEPRLQGALARRGATSPFKEAPEVKYVNLAPPVNVSLEGARPALDVLRAQQMQLPVTSQSGAGMAALNDLLGAPGYVKPARANVPAQVNPNKDDIVTAIRKLGGISTGDEAIGSLAKHYQFGPDPVGPVWRSGDKGRSLDAMAEVLHERGYISSRDALSEVMGKIEDAAIQGKQSFSAYHTPENADPLAGAIEKLVTKLDTKTAPKPPTAGYIRDNPTVPGDVAQSLRSDFTQAASSESTGRDRRLFAGMREAIDGAIDAALPEASRGQFKAINSRYGIYAGLSGMSPKQQNTFLNQLYRGGDAPDQFFTFLGMAPEGQFKDVARGFLSKLVEGATDATSNVSATKLGSLVNKANPEALKYLGGESGALLQNVGNIGQKVLREQVNNSGTGQRLLYQGLLTGSGLGLGGYLGSDGGSPGAVAGSALGAFALPKAAQAAYLSKTLRPLLTAGTKGRPARLSDKEIERLMLLLGRSPTAALLGLSQ